MSHFTNRHEPDVGSGQRDMADAASLHQPLTRSCSDEPTGADIVRSMLLLMEGRRLAFQQGFPPVPTLSQSAMCSLSSVFEPDELRHQMSAVSARIIYLSDLLRAETRPCEAAIIDDLVHCLIGVCGFFGLEGMVAALKAYGPDTRSASDYAEELILDAAAKSLVELQREQLILDLRQRLLCQAQHELVEPSPADAIKQGLPDGLSVGSVLSPGCFRPSAVTVVSVAAGADGSRPPEVPRT